MNKSRWPREEIYRDLKKQLRGLLIKDRSLRRYTTYKVGGLADIFFAPSDRDDLSNFMQYVSTNNIPFFIIGKGANLLISDAGFRGIVVNLQKGIKELIIENLTVKVGAGMILWDFLVEMKNKCLGGLERLIGIPGTVGGAIYMNAGAFGSEISDCLVSIDVMEADGTIATLKKNEIPFGYRKGFTDAGKVTLGAELGMQPCDYQSLSNTMDEIWLRRKSKQPLSYPSAGSVFKRPPGKYAGVLIEQAGLKGARIGDAVVSTKHANFILNKGRATAQNIYDLIQLIRETVYEKFNVQLELENQLVGWNDPE